MSQPAKTNDKKYKAAELRVQKILHKINALKLSNSYISQLKIPEKKKDSIAVFAGRPKYWKHAIVSLLVAVVGVSFCYQNLWKKQSCLLEVPSSLEPLFRPPEDCSMCRGVEAVIRLSNVSAAEFEERYAYQTTPVIVTDATSDWAAMKEFNFEFFKNFYRNRSMGTKIANCYFNSYKSGLSSLQEVFDMDEARANLTGKPWYVGWSTCFTEESRRLRSYYERPYFLPRTAESDALDWLFMGGPGQGANMHVDRVRHMSWQAQVRGRKRWELAPPPECFYHCRGLAFTVLSGEIVVVDTNRWYHKTHVLPGDISITIGAEYD